MDHALSEARILVLVGQIFFAYAFEAAFESTLTALSQAARGALVAGATLLLVALALLMTPAPLHYILESGQDTERFHRLVTFIVSLSLPLFGASMALIVYAMASRAVGGAWAAVLAGFLAAACLVFWEGLELLRRQRA